MPRISSAEFKQRLVDDIPNALVPLPTRTPDNDESAPVEAAQKPKGKRHEAAPADLLATDDPVIVAERLPEVARYLRDTLGYELLSNITAVDYLADGLIELVYHFMQLEGGPALVLKVRVPRQQPSVPSLTPIWRGADLQEREAYDLYGVQFPGHPNLTRVYMWDTFEGHPMRKDFPKQGDKYLADSDES